MNSSSLYSSTIAMAVQSNSTPTIFNGGTPLNEPIALLLVQALLIIALSRALHLVLDRLFKSPRVVSEVLAGMILGSGLINENYREIMWSPKSTNLLYSVAQFGIVLFEFLNGLEMDAGSSLLKSKKKFFMTGLNVLLLPLLPAIGVGWYLYSILPEITIYQDVEKGTFIFYTAFCMALTGLPVVNRILAKSNLFNTPIGDLTAEITNFNAIICWTVLMYLESLAENWVSPLRGLGIFGSLVGVFVVSWWVLGKVMIKISHMGSTSESLSQLAVILTFCIVFFFSWITQAMGSNAIFGALLIGLRTPRNHRFAIKIAEKMDDILMIILSPLYFGLIGVLTNIAFLSDSFNGLHVGLIILIVAVGSLSKILFTTLMGVYYGHLWRSSSAMGLIMYQKGYFGFVVLNIGFRAGVLPPSIFTMLAITMMISSCTSPLISIIAPKTLNNVEISTKSLAMEKVCKPLEEIGSSTLNAPSINSINESITLNELSILINQPMVQSVPSVMSLIQLFNSATQKIKVNTFRLNEITDRESSVLMSTQRTEEGTTSDPIMEVTQCFGQLNGIEMSSVSEIVRKVDLTSKMIQASMEQNFNLILIPITVAQSNGFMDELSFWAPVFSQARCPVVLFLDRGFGIRESLDASQKKDHAAHKAYFTFFDHEDDQEALSLISYMIQDPDFHVEIVSFTEKTNSKLEILKGNPKVSISYHLSQNANSIIAKEAEKLKRTDLVILGKKTYHESLHTWVDQISKASVLVVQKHAPQQKEFV